MVDLQTIQVLLNHGDWANQELIKAARELSPGRLDQPLDIGVGSLRRTLLHILAGETVWLARWRGGIETPWPDESKPIEPSEIGRQMHASSLDRQNFLQGLTPPDISRPVIYRDSKGSRFSASLGDMMIQMCLHSAHHRAQAVNIIRRVGGSPPELDYMMSIRKPA